MNKMIQCIAAIMQLPPESIAQDMTMQNTVEWDSLKHLELILALEKEYQCFFTGDEIATMTSLSAITNILQQHGHTK